MVLVLGQEVEVRGRGRSIHAVALPDTVFKLDYGVLYKQRYGHISFNLHLVLYAHEELAVLAFVLLAEAARG